MVGNSCQCPGCASYNPCAQKAGENMYCSHGSSFVCITEPAACACPTCTVGQKAGATHHQFCGKGSEGAQRWNDAHK